MAVAIVFEPEVVRAGRRDGETGVLFHFYVVVRVPRVQIKTVHDVTQILAAVTTHCVESSITVSGQNYADIELTFTSGKIAAVVARITENLYEFGFGSIIVQKYTGIGAAVTLTRGFRI